MEDDEHIAVARKERYLQTLTKVSQMLRRLMKVVGRTPVLEETLKDLKGLIQAQKGTTAKALEKSVIEVTNKVIALLYQLKPVFYDSHILREFIEDLEDDVLTISKTNTHTEI